MQSNKLKEKLDKLISKRSILEEKLFEEKLKSHQKIKNLGWGYGMRCVKMPKFTKEDNLIDKIETINIQIIELQNANLNN